MTAVVGRVQFVYGQSIPGLMGENRHCVHAVHSEGRQFVVLLELESIARTRCAQEEVIQLDLEFQRIIYPFLASFTLERK